MANHQAIGAVAEAVSRLLEQSWHPGVLAGIEPQFAVYHGKDFSAPMAAGISVFVYQVVVDPVQRTLPPALPHHKRPLPVRVWLLRAFDGAGTAWSMRLRRALLRLTDPDSTLLRRALDDVLKTHDGNTDTVAAYTRWFVPDT